MFPGKPILVLLADIINYPRRTHRRKPWLWQLLRCHLWSWLAQWTSNGSSVTAGRCQCAISVSPSSSMHSPIRNPGESQLTGCSAEDIHSWPEVDMWYAGKETPKIWSNTAPHLGECMIQSTASFYHILPLLHETRTSAHAHTHITHVLLRATGLKLHILEEAHIARIIFWHTTSTDKETFWCK